MKKYWPILLVIGLLISCFILGFIRNSFNDITTDMVNRIDENTQQRVNFLQEKIDSLNRQKDSIIVYQTTIIKEYKERESEIVNTNRIDSLCRIFNQQVSRLDSLGF